MYLDNLLANYSSDIIVESLSLSCLGTLQCVNKRLRDALVEACKAKFGSLNIYTMSKNKTTYVTVWGNGLAHIRPFIPLDDLHEEYKEANVLRLAVNETNWEDCRLFDSIYHYYNSKSLSFDEKCNLIIGKTNISRDTKECPNIVFDCY